MKKVSLVAAILLPSVLVRAQGWVDVSDPMNTPGGTTYAAMCYHPGLQTTVLIRDNDTWSYDGANWSQIPTLSDPDVSALNVTFTSTNGVTYAGTPIYAGIDRAVYDPARNGIVMLRKVSIQPSNSATPFPRFLQFFFDGNSWHYEGLPWSLPLSSNYLCLVYDSAAGATICIFHYNGWKTYRQSQNGTWQQDSQPLVTPPNVGVARSFYDPTTSRIKLLQMQLNTNISVSYEYDAGLQQWYQCFPSPHQPSAFSSERIAHDGAVGIALGESSPFTLTTVRFNSCESSELLLPNRPSYRYGYSIAYDSGRGVFVLHGGSGLADTWELTLPPGASYSTTGTGCVGTGGTPTLQSANGSLPVAGAQFNVQVSGMPWNTFAFMFLGTQNTSYAGVPLPFDLAPVGAPGCVLRAPGTSLFGFPNVLGTGLWTYTVPYAPGQTLYNQAIIFDPAANSLGLTVSNVGEAVIGS